MPDPRLVEQVADELGTSPALVEKDWHVIRALGVIGQVESGGMQIAFSGGTSLSKGWDLIKRFSEDIDFKIGEPAQASRSAGRRARGEYRQRLLDALTAADFTLEGEPLIGNDNRFFAADLGYQGQFGAGRGLRPHLRIEVSFRAPALPPVERPLQSFVAKASRQPPEVGAFPCIDIVETAADKLSALAWRVRVRQRGSPNDDPTIIRHLHDLAALEQAIGMAPEFRELVLAAIIADSSRGGEEHPPTDPVVIFDIMLKTLANDPLWVREYEQFVAAVSFAHGDEQIDFNHALASIRRLVSIF